MYQDSLCVAAKMLHDLEARGKEVTPGNVCYYVTLHMKSGAGPTAAGRTDVMGSGPTRRQELVLSFEEPAGIDPETGEEIPLGELLCRSRGRSLHVRIRNVDWEEFLDTHDHRYARTRL